MAKRTAVIDLGSNSMRMAIFEKSSRYAFHIIGEYKMKVRLGEGGYDGDGSISKEQIKKAYEAFSEYKSIAKSYKCTKIFAMGTSALRDAPNSNELICLIRKNLGINLKIIKGEDEAIYGGLAVINLLEPLDEFVTIDIGGGSTELALVSNGKVIKSISINLGTVRLKELFGDKKGNMADFLKQHARTLPSEFSCKNVVAIGGSLRAISSAIMQKQNYPIKIVHNFSYKFSNHKEFIESIANAKADDLEHFGIKKDRFDTIREGAAIFLSFIKVLDAQIIYTSGVGFREGVYLNDLLRPNKKFPVNFNLSVRSLQDRFLLHDNKSIVRYSLQIFDALATIHQLDKNLKFELSVAAKLHNISQSLGFYGEHTSSAFFVLNALNYGFSHQQKAVIAAIIAMNGKKSFSDFEKFKSLLISENSLRWLSFILVFAKSLDANCSGKKLEFEFINNTLQVSGAKQSFLAKELIKKLTKPDTFAICFV